jgi:hypothetical protein
MNKIYERLLSNRFVDKVRQNLVYDEAEFNDLLDLLRELKVELRGQPSIDKAVALHLYHAPQIVRNAFISTSEQGECEVLSNQLEDAWVDLDGIAIEILSGED